MHDWNIVNYRKINYFYLKQSVFVIILFITLYLLGFVVYLLLIFLDIFIFIVYFYSLQKYVVNSNSLHPHVYSHCTDAHALSFYFGVIL